MERGNLRGHPSSGMAPAKVKSLEAHRVDEIHGVAGEGADRIELGRIEGASEAGQVDGDAVVAIDEHPHRRLESLGAAHVLMQKDDRGLFPGAAVVVMHLAARGVDIGLLDHATLPH